MVYTIFKESTGKIVKISKCHPHLIGLQLQEDENYIEGEFLDTEYYIKNYEAVKLEKKAKNTIKLTKVVPEEEILIRSKQMELFRQQAIEELKKEGKLPEDYKGVKDAI